MALRRPTRVVNKNDYVMLSLKIVSESPGIEKEALASRLMGARDDEIPGAHVASAIGMEVALNVVQEMIGTRKVSWVRIPTRLAKGDMWLLFPIGSIQGTVSHG